MRTITGSWVRLWSKPCHNVSMEEAQDQLDLYAEMKKIQGEQVEDDSAKGIIYIEDENINKVIRLMKVKPKLRDKKGNPTGDSGEVEWIISTANLTSLKKEETVVKEKETSAYEKQLERVRDSVEVGLQPKRVNREIGRMSEAFSNAGMETKKDSYMENIQMPNRSASPSFSTAEPRKRRDPSRIEIVTIVESCLGPSQERLESIAPSWNNIPGRYKDRNNIWNQIAASWFFKGLNPSVIIQVKEEFHPYAENAVMQMSAILATPLLTEGHRIAAVAMMMNDWFGEVDNWAMPHKNDKNKDNSTPDNPTNPSEHDDYITPEEIANSVS